MSDWKTNLTPGQVNAVQGIVDQIPETMGFRDAFESILDKLASGAPPFKYLLIGEGYEVVGGTNDADLAEHIADNTDEVIIDVMGRTNELQHADYDFEEDDNDD